jgi:hypothetical protein
VEWTTVAAFSKKVLIMAPPSLVWTFLENPLHVIAMSERVVSVNDVRASDIGGYDCTLVYNMNGQQLEIPIETVEYERDKRLVTRTVRGVVSQTTWRLEPIGALTQVTSEVDYRVDMPVINGVAASVAARMGENDLEKVLYRLKDNVEAVYQQQRPPQTD